MERSFLSVRELRVLAERWRIHYKTIRGCLKNSFEIGHVVRMHVIERGAGKSLRY
jgi:hypothetical protein